MEKESLVKARELVFKVINDSKIETLDKYEILLNLYNFLDPYSYEETIKTLEKSRWNKNGHK